MDILILGGTVFLGRALVDAAQERGHHLTLFNRGRTNPGLFPEVEQIHGSRDGELSALEGRTWDAVIDTCGYVPRVVRQSAQLLSKAASHYTFISSLSVYAGTSQPGLDESAPVGKLADETVEQITNETYGPLKALCEQAVEQEFPGRALIIRPGLIVGPYDPSDRFTYWPYRVSQGGEVLAPGQPDRTVQFIDVRDLAAWTIRMVEANQTGVYNADGPAALVSMAHLLEACRGASRSEAEFTWVGEEFLTRQEVGPWMEMPLWIPASDPDSAGFFAFDVRKAISAGLTFRPVEEIVQAVLDWLPERAGDRPWRAGLTREREAELLRLWHASLED